MIQVTHPKARHDVSGVVHVDLVFKTSAIVQFFSQILSRLSFFLILALTLFAVDDFVKG